MSRLSQALRAFGPAMGDTGRRELARATLGTALAILLCDLALWALRHFTPSLPGGMGDPLREVILVSPFAATAFLILTVPNSPLAQPWSVVVGNSLGAASGVICAMLVPSPVLAASLAVALSVLVMSSARALHPPGAAMALNAVLLAYAGGDAGPGFILATVSAGSLVLVGFGMGFNAATGRRYPFRPASDALPAEAAYLTDLLERLRLSANIGVADLSRLIAAAEAEATAHHLGHMTAAGMMTPNPLSLAPDAPLPSIKAAFADHPYHTIPVVQNGAYLGLVSQLSLISAAEGVVARDLVQSTPSVGPSAEMPAILPNLMAGALRVVPVVSDGKLVGIITRSDLINVMARALRTASD